MVELATKAANGTYGQSERDKVQDEMFALLDDIDRVSEGTNFNGTNLLDGSLSKRDPSAATKAKLVMDTTNLSATVGAEGKASVRINGKMVTWDVKVATAGTTLEDGSVKFEDALKSAGFEADSFEITYAANAITIEAKDEGKNRISAFKLTGAATTATTTATVSGTAGEDGLGKAARGAGAALKLQIGDTNDEFNKISVDVKEMSVEGLGIVELDISTQEAAGASISKIRSAIEKFIL